MCVAECVAVYGACLSVYEAEYIRLCVAVCVAVWARVTVYECVLQCVLQYGLV